MNNLFGRYELIDPDKNHKKFWEVKPVGREYEVRWGRIGSTGQSQIVDEVTAFKRIHEKMAKGYQKVGSETVTMDETREKIKKIKPKKKAPKKLKSDSSETWVEELKRLANE